MSDFSKQCFIKSNSKNHSHKILIPHALMSIPCILKDVSQKTLEHFILGTKMSLEEAKRKLDMFYTMKRLVPELFTDRDPRGTGLTCLKTIVYVRQN